MPVSDRSTLDVILRAMARRLAYRVPNLGEMNCFVTDQPQPVAWPPDTRCVTICFARGTFPEPFYAGGGGLTLCEQCVVDVTAWVRLLLDRVPQIEEALLSSQSGLFATWKADILRALLVSNPAEGTVRAWDPRGADNVCLLRNQLSPISCSPPRSDETGQWLDMTISFDVTFDWRL